MPLILSNASADSDPFYWNGGPGTFSVKATWGGGTVKLQYRLPDGSTYDDVDQGSDTYCTLTEDGSGNFDIGPCYLKIDVVTATAVYARVDGRKR